MPIRFQVDPDFYDHPKTLDASDAAVALWTRAGSYSAAKTLDGFVPDGMLARLSKTPEEAAAELVRRGLWKRVRGGFQFHQWEQRNLTKARVEADRDYDRTRKQRERQTTRRNGHAQVTPANVRTGHHPDVPPESNQDSGGSPDRSVSLSVSESVSVSVSGQARSEPNLRTDDPGPPARCPKHREDPDPPPCRNCAEHRAAREQWDRDHAAAQQRAQAEARSAAARARAEAVRAAIDACQLCDQAGYRDGALCAHDPDSGQRAARGAAAARAALRGAAA